MSIGQTIKLLRVSSGLKQKDLADRLRVSPNYLSLVENDKREPSISFLKDVARTMGIPLGLLFIDVDNRSDNLSPEERMLVMRIKDLLFEIQRIRLQNEDADGGEISKPEY